MNAIEKKVLSDALQLAIQEGVFPGASCVLSTSDQILFSETLGFAKVSPNPVPLTNQHLFDTASLTKAFCTTLLCMTLCSSHQIDVNQPLSDFFDLPSAKKPILIRHLLQHTSGLSAWRPYYEEFLALHPDIISTNSESIPFGKFKPWLTERILKDPLEAEVGQKRIYSDLGFILLGQILEKISHQSLDSLFDEFIASPLGLKNSFFVKLPASCPANTLFAATEQCPWRKRVLCGEVHDDHAFLLGGVAGHAGLFSTAEDLAKISRALLLCFQGKNETGFVFTQKTFLDFVTPRPPFGFDFPTPPRSQAGSQFSDQTIGHLGYTGTSWWIDLKRDLFVILLTNRVHPTRTNEKIKEFRPKFHDLVVGFVAH